MSTNYCTSTNLKAVGFSGDILQRVAPALLEIVNDLKEYWPLTVRQVYYQAVSRGVLSNNLAEYNRVSRVLTKLRRAELVPWSAIEDRSRRTVDKRGVSGVAEFISGQLETFLDWRFYHRCLVQAQDNYVEASLEKDALSSIYEEATWPYCVRLNIVRGQASADLVNKMAARFTRAAQGGQTPILLHFGDFDPTGVQIPVAIQSAMKEHHGIDVDVRASALTPEQITHYSLPDSIDAAKKSDPNYKRFAAKFGDSKPVELDALHPKHQIEMVREALAGVLNIDSMKAEQAIEECERSTLKTMRRDVLDYMRQKYPDTVTN